MQEEPAMGLHEQKRKAKDLASAGASRLVNQGKEKEREAERKALPTNKQLINLLGKRDLPQDPAADVANQVCTANQMQMEKRHLMRAKDLRLRAYPGAYDLCPPRGKPGLILARDPNKHGATNWTVFKKEKKCLVDLGATEASANEFLRATADNLRRELEDTNCLVM